MNSGDSRRSRQLKNAVPLLASDGAHVGLAEPGRRFDQRLEHRLQIEGRAADDLEHVGGGGLLLQRFARARACAPAPRRTAARSRSRSPPGRRRSSTSSICLSVNGRTVLRVKTMHADRRSFAQQRHAEHGANAADLLPLDRCCIPDRPATSGIWTAWPLEHDAPDDATRAPAAIGWPRMNSVDARRVSRSCRDW